MRATTSVDAFVELVLASGLLTREQVEQTGLSSETTAAEAARALVRVRLLTPFQARSLLADEPRAFFVTERYKILEHLGRGGMGEVFMVEHLLLRRVVAMKLIIPAGDTGSGGRGRWSGSSGRRGRWPPSTTRTWSACSTWTTRRTARSW